MLMGTDECVYSVFAISGAILFPPPESDLKLPKTQEQRYTCVEDDITTWWRNLSYRTNPLIVVDLLMSASEGVFTSNMETCHTIACRMIDENILASKEFSFFRSALKGLSSTESWQVQDGEQSWEVCYPFSPCAETGDEIRFTVERIFHDNWDKYEAYSFNAIQSNFLTAADMMHTMTRWNRTILESNLLSDSCTTIDDILIEKLNELITAIPDEGSVNRFLDDPMAASQSVLFSLTSQPASVVAVSLSTATGNSFAQWSLLDIQQRISFLFAFNCLLFETFLSFLDTTSTDNENLGALVRIHKNYLLSHFKTKFLSKALANTSSNNSKNSNPGYQSSSKGLPAQVRLDNFLASKSRECHETRITDSKNCFVQAFQQLHDKDSKIYRFIFSTDRVFHIQFEKESGIDAGGVFREGVTRIIEDLFLVNDFELLTHSPNVSSLQFSQSCSYPDLLLVIIIVSFSVFLYFLRWIVSYLIQNCSMNHWQFKCWNLLEVLWVCRCVQS